MSLNIDSKDALSFSFTKHFLYKSNVKQSPNKFHTAKKFKTPKPILNYKRNGCLTGDRFIPLKTDNENIQNFLLKSSNSQNDQSVHMKNENNSIKYSPCVPKSKKFSSFLLDSLLVKSADDFSVDKAQICTFSKSKNQLLTFSRRAKPYSTKPFLTQMRNYFNSPNFLLENKKPSRIISAIPERILDAPNLQDDYYLNLLDWGSLNMLSVALGNEVYLWSGETSETSLLLASDEDNPITSVSWMSSGNCLSVGYSSGEVELWDTVKGAQIRTMEGHNDRVSSLAWNCYILSSGSKDAIVINHDVRSKNHLVSCLSSHRQEVCALKYNSEGCYLASGGNDNMVYIWDVKKMNCKLHSLIIENDADIAIRPLMNNNAHCAAVKALAWCPWQRNLLASGGGTRDKTIKFFNCDSGNVIGSVNTGSQVCALLWNRREKELISSHGFSKNQICIWNYPKMTKVTELKGHMSRVLYLVMSPDETTIVSGAGDETLRFWKVNDKINEISMDDDEELNCDFKLR